jgi:glycerol uptake facilitator-like aquaporin
VSRDQAAASAGLGRRIVAEGLGTAMLLAVIIGSGIMAERLAGGNEAVALLANMLATAGGLIALILTFGPVSGAHFNPVVTLADASQGGIAWRDVAPYIVAQIIGALLGAIVANLMFELPAIHPSEKARAGANLLLSEAVATFGLLAVIWGTVRRTPDAVPFAVGAYIAAAYWFTSSTSFANPAVTVARSLSDTFAGIRAADVLPFVGAQLVGAAAATILFRWLVPSLSEVADRVTVPHDHGGK